MTRNDAAALALLVVALIALDRARAGRMPASSSNAGAAVCRCSRCEDRRAVDNLLRECTPAKPA